MTRTPRPTTPVVVVNPYGFPELQHLAAGLAAGGVPTTYVTTLAFAHGGALHRAAERVPLGGVRRLLLKRVLPEGLAPRDVRLVAWPWEVVHQVVRNFTTRETRPVMVRESRAFGRSVGRWLSRGRGVRLVVGVQGDALPAFARRPRGASLWLSYPIAHHRWMERMLAVEAAENPGWARYLQGHDLPPETSAALDEEIARADRVLVGSSFVRRTFADSGVSVDAVEVTPLGAHLPEQPARASRAPGPLRVLFVGQLTQRKGLSYLLDAVRDLPAGTAQLRLVGPPVLDVADRITGRPDVEVVGAVPRAELGEHFAWADVAVLPSLAEGFPLSALEAMAHGVPLVLTDNTFASDLVEHGSNGYVVPARDAAALSAALAGLAERPDELREVGAAGRRTAAGYTWGAYQRLMTSLVREHLEQTGDRP